MNMRFILKIALSCAFLFFGGNVKPMENSGLDNGLNPVMNNKNNLDENLDDNNEKNEKNDKKDGNENDNNEKNENNNKSGKFFALMAWVKGISLKDGFAKVKNYFSSEKNSEKDGSDKSEISSENEEKAGLFTKAKQFVMGHKIYSALALTTGVGILYLMRNRLPVFKKFPFLGSFLRSKKGLTPSLNLDLKPTLKV